MIRGLCEHIELITKYSHLTKISMLGYDTMNLNYRHQLIYFRV